MGALTQDQEEIILHTMKAIADSWRRHNKYTHDMIDDMAKELNIEVPDRRINGDRRIDGNPDKK